MVNNTSPSALVVYDNYMTRTLIAEFLEDEGYAVRNFDLPEDVDCNLSNFDVIVMDVRFRRYLPDKAETRPYAGIDYVVEKIQEGSIDPTKTKIVFVTRWGQRPEAIERLQQVQAHEWIDISTGLELTELSKVLGRTSRP